MKNIIIAFISFVSFASAQTTFSGQKAEWGWSGKNYSKDAVIGILEENWGKTSVFNLQAKVDGVTNAEFLWNVTPQQALEAQKTASSYIVGGAKVTGLQINLQPSGKGEIYLFQGENLVGRVRCQSAAKREGKNSQLTEGEYDIRLKKQLHISQEFKGARMPNAMLLYQNRGIYIHNGDLSSTSGGCIRVSEPVGRELFRLVPQGVKVKVVWKD